MKLVNVDVSRVKEVMRHCVCVCVCVCDPRGIYGDSLFKWNLFKIRFKGGVNRLGKGTARKARKALY